MKKLILLLFIALFLGACTPTTNEERVEVVQLTDTVSYYPHEVGARWQYLSEGALVSDFPVVTNVLGPTVVNGDIWIATNLTGQGLQNTFYRQYRDSGVFILKEERPGQIVSYDPPIQEFPEVNRLSVGRTWGGNTNVDVFWPDAKAGKQHITSKISYSYQVVDKRTVTVPAGQFEAFIINFVASTVDDSDLSITDLKQEIWFVPFVGEVRTENGFFLVETNVTGVKRK